MDQLFGLILQIFGDFVVAIQRRNTFILFLIASIIILVLAYQFTDNPERPPCAPETYPMRCYRIRPDACEILWKATDTQCQEAIKKLSLPPTRLIGPLKFKCQVAMLDKAVKGTRISEGDCEEKHKELDEWKMTYPEIMQN